MSFSKLKNNDLIDKVDVPSNPHLFVKMSHSIVNYVCPNIKMSIKFFPLEGFQRILDISMYEKFAF